mgnify:CR=1 FL=1
MGMSAQQPGKQNGSRRRGQRMAPMSEINVTPLVDVMLVLLIVFMVAAPLLTVSVPVDLPKTRSAPLSGDDEPLTITVNGDGAIFLQETEVQVEDSCRAFWPSVRTAMSSASMCAPIRISITAV